MAKVQKTKKAVALGYNRQKDNAPKVLATGSGEVAKNIINLAKSHDIPIKEDADLVEILSKVDLNENFMFSATFCLFFAIIALKF